MSSLVEILGMVTFGAVFSFSAAAVVCTGTVRLRLGKFTSKERSAGKFSTSGCGSAASECSAANSGCGSANSGCGSTDSGCGTAGA